MSDIGTMAIVAKNMAYIEDVVAREHKLFKVNYEDVLSRTIELLISSPFDSARSSFNYYVTKCVKYACHNIYDDMMSTQEFTELTECFEDTEYDRRTSCVALESEFESMYNKDIKAFKYILSALKGDVKVTKLGRNAYIKSDISDIYDMIKDSCYSVQDVIRLMTAIEKRKSVQAIV